MPQVPGLPTTTPGHGHRSFLGARIRNLLDHGTDFAKRLDVYLAEFPDGVWAYVDGEDIAVFDRAEVVAVEFFGRQQRLS